MLKGLNNYVQILKYIKQGIQNAFSRHLLLTNVAISLGLSGTGDVIQQQYRIKCKEQQSWDRLRTRNMTCTGVTTGILSHHWYQLLDHRLPGRTLKIVSKKLLFDQILFSPVCIVVFLATLKLLNGLSSNSSLKDKAATDSNLGPHREPQFSLIEEETINKGWRLYLAEWIVWPPVQVINFYFLPTKYRVLYDNTISLLYDIYSSHVVHSSNKNKNEKKLILAQLVR